MGKINGKHLDEDERPEIIYVFDPLCGWCYGFSAVIEKVYDELHDRIDFLVLSGGMVTGNRIGPISQVAPYIKDAYKSVEQATGVKFGEKFIHDILAKGDAVFNSIPPSKALAVFRLLKPGEVLGFASRLQKAIYYEGIMVEDLKAYGSIAGEFGLNPEKFILKMQEPETEEIIQNEFRMAKGLGVAAYPTVLLRRGKNIDNISTGYRDYDHMIDLIEDALNDNN
jgi:putative protein-disulfide isomerase